MQVTITPSEFTVRFALPKTPTEAIPILGAYIRQTVSVFDVDGSVTYTDKSAQPVAIAGALGFPLDGILEAIHVGSIVAADNAVAALNAANVAIAEKDAEIVALKAQIYELQNSIV
jgi:hypothetical protein